MAKQRLTPLVRNKEVRSIAVDPKVWAMVEASAKHYGVPVSQYVEGALLWDQIEEGNTEAWKIGFGRIKARMRSRLLPRIEEELAAESA